jgi:hypothetical protein
MLDASNPPSSPLLLDPSTDIGSLLVAGFPTKPLPKFGTYVVLMGISSVVTLSSQISAYVGCQ